MTDHKKVDDTSRIIDSMFNNDAFSQWLGIERIAEGPGHCTIRMKIRQEMTNGFGIAHGGISYSFADSAFAFASNSLGRKSVSIETSISHLKSLKLGDTITATAFQKSVSNKLGIWVVDVINQDNELVAIFKGTVYRTSKTW